MIVILGAGVTGLCAGWELKKQGCDDFVILEAGPEAGGLAGSILDENGFTWDHGGHVVFSHYGEFDRLLLELMGDEVEHHSRTSHVRHGEAWVPYPFQDHPRYLKPEDQLSVIEGLIRATDVDAGADPDFATWAQATFGPGIYELFFKPYNEKVWSTPLSKMSSSWVRDRVSTPDWRKALQNIITGEDTAWGPNATFTFPSRGGTGEIWRRLAARLDGHIHYDARVTKVNLRRRDLQAVTPPTAKTYRYDTLISTIPLDQLCRLGTDPALVQSANALRHNQVYVVGLGYRSDEPLPDWSWTYWPQKNVPFYRVTNFAKYARANAPEGCHSYMCEVSAPAHATGFTRERLLDACHLALLEHGVADGELVTEHVHHLPYAYPIPTLGRDAALDHLLPALEHYDVLSRGRFGAWRYEVGNQDHSAVQGLEAARRALSGERETVVWDKTV